MSSSSPISFRARLLAAALGGLVAAATVSADSLKLSSTPYSGVGGVFSASNSGLDLSAYSSSALYNGGFGTFCLEYNEHFTPGGTYNFTMASFANAGGVSGQTSPGQDPISLGTAWLYSQFATGSLTGYSYTSSSSALALQNAFWFLEGEGQGNVGNSYVQLAITQFGDLSSAQTHADGAFGVSVLNLTSGANNQNRHQSQLYFAGLPSSVPDAAATLPLLGAVLAGLAYIRRRSTRQ